MSAPFPWLASLAGVSQNLDVGQIADPHGRRQVGQDLDGEKTASRESPFAHRSAFSHSFVQA